MRVPKVGDRFLAKGKILTIGSIEEGSDYPYCVVEERSQNGGSQCYSEQWVIDHLINDGDGLDIFNKINLNQVLVLGVVGLLGYAIFNKGTKQNNERTDVGKTEQ